MAYTIRKIQRKSGVVFSAIIKNQLGEHLKSKTFQRKGDAEIWAKRIEADTEKKEALGLSGAGMTFVLPTNHPLRCTPQGNRSENNVANDIDPSDVRKEKKQTQQIVNENQKRIEAGLPVVGSFGEVALEFFEMMQTWAGYLDGLKVGASNTVQKAKINCVIHS